MNKQDAIETFRFNQKQLGYSDEQIESTLEEISYE